MSALQSGIECHLLQHFFHSQKALGAFHCKMKRLALQLLVPCVEESDDGRSFSEVPPSTLKDVVLPFHLFGSWLRAVTSPAKAHRLAAIAIVGALAICRVGVHVTNPGSARRAPSESRALRICSA